MINTCFYFSQTCNVVLEGSCVKNLDMLAGSRFDTAILNGHVDINSIWFEWTLWSDPVQPLLKSATSAQCQHARAAWKQTEFISPSEYQLIWIALQLGDQSQSGAVTPESTWPPLPQTTGKVPAAHILQVSSHLLVLTMLAPQHLSVTENRMLCALMPFPLGPACFMSGVLLFVRCVMAWSEQHCTVTCTSSCLLAPVFLSTLWRFLCSLKIHAISDSVCMAQSHRFGASWGGGRHTGKWTDEYYYIIHPTGGRPWEYVNDINVNVDNDMRDCASSRQCFEQPSQHMSGMSR